MNSLTDNLMKTSDEELWKHAGLFGQVDALSFNQHTFPPLPSSTNTHLNSAVLPAALTSPLPSLVPPVPPPAYTSSFYHDREILSSGQDSLSAPTGLHRPPHSRKVWKAKRKTARLVLGDEVGLEDLYRMYTCTLVGRFSYKKLSS